MTIEYATYLHGRYRSNDRVLTSIIAELEPVPERKGTINVELEGDLAWDEAHRHLIDAARPGAKIVLVETDG